MKGVVKVAEKEYGYDEEYRILSSNKFGKTGLAIALDGLRMMLKPKPTDCKKIKEVKKRIAIQVAEYDEYY